MRLISNLRLDVKVPLALAGWIALSFALAFGVSRLAMPALGPGGQMVLAWVLASLGTAIGAAMAVHWGTRRLGLNAAALRDFARGNFDAALPPPLHLPEVQDFDGALRDLRASLCSVQEAHIDAAQHSGALSQAAQAILLVDEAGLISFANAAAGDLFQQVGASIQAQEAGFAPLDLVGQDLHLLLPEGGFGVLDEGPCQIDLTFGNCRLRLDARALEDMEGAACGAVVAVVDVTQDLRAAAFVSAVQNSQMVLELDSKGQILALNARTLEVLGEEGRTWVASNFVDHLSSQASEFKSAFASALAGSAEYCALDIQVPSGASQHWQGFLSPLENGADIANSVLCLMSDMSFQHAALAAAEADHNKMLRAQADVVESMRSAMTQLADGDLTAQISTAFPAQYEQLRLDFNRTATKLNEAIKAVGDNANSIRGEVLDISNAAADLSQRTERQAATLEQTAAAIEQLTVSVSAAADGAHKANDVVLEAKSNAEQSGDVVNQAVAAMGQISASSDKISKIIGVIDDIAFQTNLLALNAGVEAARAGDAGRGFAVVASEVRALAQRSSDAAKEINTLISSSSSQVRHGVDLVGEAGEALKEIVGFVSNISEHVSGIALSTREQSGGLGEINIAMSQLDQVTQQNAAMFEETTAASQALNREADKLMTLIQLFRTGGVENLSGAGQSGRSSARASVQGANALNLGAVEAADSWEDF